MKRLFVALLCSIFACFPAFAAERPDILEVMKINGVIDDRMASMVADQVEAINENKRIKAVLMEVDSPGGGVIASAAIYEELSKLKVPVVAWCNSICASGGMYISMAPTVKYIGVRTQTISGSIGVIMTITRSHRLMAEKLKIDTETFKSGRLKDAGSSSRAAEPGEVEHLQGMVQGLADDFYEIVKKSRGDKIKDWDGVKSARIYFGTAGVKVGLVDGVVSKDEAAKRAKELSGSRLIYTRDELKRMSKDAQESSTGDAIYGAPQLDWLSEMRGDARWFMQWIREIRQGQSVRVEYRTPWEV